MAKRNRKTREERLQQIWEAARKIFLQKGFRNTFMEDIIKETDLSKGGFYHYYQNTKQIMMDLMRNGNVMYIKTNKMISGLTEETDKEEICNCLINALLEKILVPTPDRKLYLMFAYEMMYDSDFQDTFLELEKDFIDNLCEKIGVNKDDKREFKIFISRMINALTFAQNLFPQPTIIQHQEERLRDFFKPMIMDFMNQEKRHRS
ncbi:TetR/AcrR family transcriptional regulator [Clostridium botulinum]